MKLVKEILYEKFTSESDPIKDLGIGMLNRDKNFKNYSEFYKWLIKCLPYILETSKIPDDIISEKTTYIKVKYFHKLCDYFRKYKITIHESNLSFLLWPEELRKRLMRRGFKTWKTYNI